MAILVPFCDFGTEALALLYHDHSIFCFHVMKQNKVQQASLNMFGKKIGFLVVRAILMLASSGIGRQFLSCDGSKLGNQHCE